MSWNRVAAVLVDRARDLVGHLERATIHGEVGRREDAMTELHRARTLAEIVSRRLALPAMTPEDWTVDELVTGGKGGRILALEDWSSEQLMHFICAELLGKNRDRAVRAIKQHYDAALERELGKPE